MKIRTRLSTSFRHTTARLGLAVALVIGTSTFAADLTGDLPSPGHYEITTATSFSDGTLPDTTVTTQNCLTREDLESDPASVFASLPEGKSCDVGKFLMEDGEISMRISCAAPEGDMTMTVTGTYENETYQMLSDVVIKVGEQQVTMQSSIDGKRVGDC